MAASVAQPTAKMPMPQASSPAMDAERIALLLLQEATPSLAKATRVLAKLAGVGFTGYLLANCYCYLVPLGVILLAIAAAWVEIIGEECGSHRFFPHKAMNSLGAVIFRWQCLALVGALVWFASRTDTLRSMQFAFAEDNTKVLVMVVLPLALMILGRSLEPYQFGTARAEVKDAEQVLRQVLASKSENTDTSPKSPFVDTDSIPLYKLGAVAKLLHGFVASHDASDKLSVNLTPKAHKKDKSMVARSISFMYSPFRSVASDLFLWDKRDLVLYSVAALYFLTVYISWFYFPFTPLCLAAPFLGPKSKAGAYVRALQQDIRVAQGQAVEKKGGLTPSAVEKASAEGMNWPMTIYLGLSHFFAFYGLLVWIVFGGSCPLVGNGIAMGWKTFAWAFFLYVVGGLGITGGAHRLWAHRTYKAAFPLRVVMMIFNSIANQGSIFHWARDHRVHHLYSDTPADPHDANRGFWFSHVGWLLVKKKREVVEAGKKLKLDDLYNDPVVMFQHRADPFWNLLWCFAFPSFVAVSFGDSLWNGFLIAGCLRYCITLNATWAVNSVVHAFGTKPYNSAHLTTENGWVSLFAMGEGWHNWHHAFDWDYATAELGPLQQYNPTKVFIDAMACLGLVWDRKRALKVWQARKTRWEEQCGRKVVETIEGPPLFRRRVVTFGPAYDEEPADGESKHD
eukprot:TRINITY_DN1953_c0_g1_i6.p1 TRINITY_DN1953_c0_g1~~TRINITY_DN1953_c0_g1_i6.p1  ORF type:complete len:692 (+),score=131.28 TRINITY_DN1953_c0_g1_i6:36-2078(+)